MMKTSKVSFRLSPNEEAFVLQKERDRRRKLRIQQVREQERIFAKLVRKQVEVKKKQELSILADQLEQEWLENKLEEKETLDQLYRKTLESIGRAHASAKEQPPFDEIRERVKVENSKKAKERGKKAIEKQQKDDEEKTQEEFALIMARKTALEIERARAALIAKKPHPKSTESEVDPVKQPTKVLHHEGFSTTHYTIPHEYVEKADPEEQGDAKMAAIDEEERVKEETEEKQQEMKERQTKAAMRQKHAQEKQRLNRARTDLMEELGQMEQADRRRRQLIVSNIPKQIFQPPYKRLEEKEDHQRDLEEAFENMYMAKTDYVGDLELALEPALPLVEADLDLSSDTPGEVFQLPEKKVPKKFPQGLDESDKRDVPAKKDTLKKLLRKIHSQKQDHNMRKKAELVGDVVDTSSLAPSVSSVPSTVLSSTVTPSSVMDDSGQTEASSSQISSQLSQHPLSSRTTSQTTSNGGVSVETGTISEGSSDAVGVTLMHPLEEARRVRGKEQVLQSQDSLKSSDIRQRREHPEAFEMLPSEPLTPLTMIPSQDSSEDTQGRTYVEENNGHTVGAARDQGYNGEVFQDTVEPHHTSLQHDGCAVGDSITSGFDGGGIHASVAPDPHCHRPLYIKPSVRDDANEMKISPLQRQPLPHAYQGSGQPSMTSIGDQELPREYMPHHHRRSVDVNKSMKEGSHDLGGTNGQHGHDFVQHATFSRLQGGNENKLGSYSRAADQIVTRSHPGTVNNKNTVLKGESVHRYESAPNGFPQSHQQIHQEQGVDVSSDGISVNSVEAMPPSHLESVRRKYPNIYETLTGKKPPADVNKESLSDHDLKINNPPHVQSLRRPVGHASRSIVKTPQKDDLRRHVTLRKMSPPKRGNKVGVSVEDHTADEEESVISVKETTFQRANKPANPNAEFQSLLHEYQQQLLKLQRTNETDIMEAQSKLRERRQRLLELYPLSKKPSMTNSVNSKRETLTDFRSESRWHGHENVMAQSVVGEPPAHRGVFVARQPMEENQGLNSSSGSFMPVGSESRHSNGILRDRKNGEYKSDPNFPTRGQFRIPGVTAHQTMHHLNGSYVSNGEISTSPNVPYFNPVDSLQDMTSQSFSTPPLYQDQIRNGSHLKPVGPSHFLPLSSKSSTTEGQSSQYDSPLISEDEEPSTSAFRVVSSQEKVTEKHEQLFPEPDKHDLPPADVQHRPEPVYFQEDQTLRESYANAQVTWRPVKRVHVSLPTATNEQSPAASSVLGDHNSPFLKSPLSADKSKALNGAVLEQGLLTPRKLTQLESNPVPSRSHNISLDNRQQDQRPSILESPGKLITPRMLLGNQIDKQGSKATGIPELKESSAKGYGSTLMSPSSRQRPHYDDNQQRISETEGTLISTDTSLASQKDGVKNSKGFEQNLFSDTTASGLTQAHSLPSSQISQSSHDHMRAESTRSSTISSSLQNVRESSKFGWRQAFFSHEWHDSEIHNSLSQKFENQNIDGIQDLHFEEKDVNRKETGGTSETEVQQRFELQSLDPERNKHLSSDDVKSGLEEPTDKGLLEALKNLMLAKARSQVPGTATTTTNYFGHLDLTNFDRSENDSVGMKDEAAIRKDGETEENVEIQEPVTEMETTDEAENDENERQKFHHRPPMASYSKLMAFDEVAPHELSTIIEVESPLFETLPELSLANGSDTSRRLNGEFCPPIPPSNDGTSSSSWGTPQHHEPDYSQSSGLASSQDIYIHGPTLASSLEEGELVSFKESKHTGVRNEPKINQLSSEIVTDISDGVSAPTKHPLEVTSKQIVDENLTISEGPLNTSSETSISLSETMDDDCQTQKDLPEHGELFPLSSEILRMRNVSSEAVETKSYSTKPPHPKISQRDGEFLRTVMSQSMKESGVSATNSLESSRIASQSAIGSSLQNSTLQSAIGTSVDNSAMQSSVGTSQRNISLQSAVGTSLENFTSQSAIGISLQNSTLQPATATSMDLSGGSTSDVRRSFNDDGKNLSGYGSTYIPPYHGSQQNEASSVNVKAHNYHHDDENSDKTFQELSERRVPPVSHIADSQKSHKLVTPLEEGPLENTLEETKMTIVSQEDDTFHMLVPQETISESLDNPSKVHQSSDDDSKEITSLKHLGIDRRSFTPGASPARFFSEISVHQSAIISANEHKVQKHSIGENEAEPPAVERGIMEEPELTFQTTFDTNMTLGSVIGEPIEGGNFASPSESLLSFIRHEEQFAHSTPMKRGSSTSQPQETAVEAEGREKLNQNSNARGGPLTLQEALARHKAGFIKASKARQIEVKEQRKSEMQSGTAFAMTLKNWQKARLQAQHKNRRKGVKKSSSNKENEARTGPAQKVKMTEGRKEVQKVKTSQDRKESQTADKERTKRLYNQLEEVRQRQADAQRQKTYAENRKKRKEYEEKLKKRRILLKSQAQQKT